MKTILVTGASGFIARSIITHLLSAGYKVIACARNTNFVKTIFPQITVLSCDFVNDTDPSVWIPRLQGVDIVINCVGVFQTQPRKHASNIHYDTPKALFDACLQTGVKKIIQLSALGIDQSTVAYATTKRQCEDYLKTLDIPHAIIRPSLVYGPGSYGGSSLFRGFCGLPFIMALPGKATQLFQPIHIDDLAKIMHELVELPGTQHIPAVGADTVDLKTILNNLRRWLGFKKAFNIHIPMFLVKLGAKIGDLMKDTPINSTGVKLMNHDNVASKADIDKMHAALSFKPRGFLTALFETPSQVQDRWHARMFFLKPLLRLSLAFLWLWTAWATYFIFSIGASFELLHIAGISFYWQWPVFIMSCGINTVIGLMILLNRFITFAGTLGIVIILLYTIIITINVPVLWFHPLGAIAKNIPILVAMGIMMALESNR